MTERKINHLGDEWLFRMSGYGIGVGTGRPPKPSSWGVDISSPSDPTKPAMHTQIWSDRLDQLSEDQLRRVLEEELVVSAIERSKWVWRTAEGIGNEVGLPAERVHALLNAQADRVVESIRPNREGKLLYTTRSKYKDNRSFFGRYLDVLDSSVSGSSE